MEKKRFLLYIYTSYLYSLYICFDVSVDIENSAFEEPSCDNK